MTAARIHVWLWRLLLILLFVVIGVVVDRQVGDRIYRHEVRDLMPQVEGWLREALEPHGIELDEAIPNVSPKPDPATD